MKHADKLRKLKVGEYLVEDITSHKAHSRYRKTARRAGIKIKIVTLPNGEVQVWRVA